MCDREQKHDGSTFVGGKISYGDEYYFSIREYDKRNPILHQQGFAASVPSVICSRLQSEQTYLAIFFLLFNSVRNELPLNKVNGNLRDKWRWRGGSPLPV